MSFDQQRSEAFADRMMGALNEAALCLMTSIGHRTGLFDVMADMPPAKSEEIADKAGLNERYVREWLGALVTADVVEFNSHTREYSLPREHEVLLTRRAEPNNLAVFAQYIPVLSHVEDDILDIEPCQHVAGVVVRFNVYEGIALNLDRHVAFHILDGARQIGGAYVEPPSDLERGGGAVVAAAAGLCGRASGPLHRARTYALLRDETTFVDSFFSFHPGSLRFSALISTSPANLRHPSWPEPSSHSPS